MKPVLLLTLLTTCASATADDLKIARPFLWKVDGIPTDDGTTKHAYLFGTIHVPDEGLTKMHPTAQSAWEDAGAVYFEIDFVNDGMAQTAAISLPEGKTLEDLVSEELVSRVDKRLKGISPLMTRGGVLPEAHVVMWPILIETLKAQVGAGGLPMDMKLYADAMGRDRIIGGLEDARLQLKPLTDLSLEEQTEFLTASLDQMDKDDASGEDRMGKLKSLYASGDEKAFHEYFEADLKQMAVSEDLQTLFKKTLLGDRNERMAMAIIDRMKKTPDRICFFAVGCGHLIGDDSVQVSLKKQSVASARVPEQKAEAKEDE